MLCLDCGDVLAQPSAPYFFCSHPPAGNITITSSATSSPTTCIECDTEPIGLEELKRRLSPYSVGPSSRRRFLVRRQMVRLAVATRRSMTTASRASTLPMENGSQTPRLPLLIVSWPSERCFACALRARLSSFASTIVVLSSRVAAWTFRSARSLHSRRYRAGSPSSHGR